MKMISWMLNKVDTPAGRKGRLSGEKHWKVEQKDLNAVGGRSAFVAQAEALEAEGLIRVKWYDVDHTDAEIVHFRLENLSELYRRAGKTPPWEKIAVLRNELEKRRGSRKKSWIAAWENHLMEQLDRGTIPAVLEREEFLCCADALDGLEEPEYKRLFSARCLRDSKAFERDWQREILTAARRHSALIEDAMSDTEALEQIGILEYGQQLYLKGRLLFELNGEQISTEKFFCGVTLNSMTLKLGKPLPQQIPQVISIENQANFEAAEYREDTLYNFSHGYFSPREAEFLRKLLRCLGPETSYYHWGDLDYGGVRIFQYIRTKIFPGLQPLYMDRDLLARSRNLGYGGPLSDSVLKKLDHFQEPVLQELIEEMKSSGWGVEQECFLTPELNIIR